MKFRDFLLEKKENHAVLAFGRMNPITSGHQKLVDTVKKIASRVNGSHHIILSHSQDPKKNPLSAAQKVKHAKRAFPGTNFSASDSSAPNFLAQAAKLHQSGVTHLHMIGGSDRVEEFHRLLHKYNGTHQGALFNFKKIEVHSAGDRDPDAEGTTGISASKMREHAKNKNYNEFKKGAPTTMSDAHVKQMYNDVRKGMGLKEDIDFEFEELLTEGVHDKAIFKAVFLAGGPGSGKDYVLSNTLDGQGMVEINSDKALEFLMDKKGLDKRMPESEKEARDLVRGRAKNMTEVKQRLALQGRNGLIINGTGDDPEKIARIKKGLEDLGYESSMVLVNTSDEVSAARNIERGQRGGRTVPETIRKQKWDAVQNARTEYARMFGDGYMEFDNSEDLREADPETVKAKKDEMLQIFKSVQNFITQPPKSEQSQEWIANELQQADKGPKPKNGVEQVPPSDSEASSEARQLGLQYYGFGRYGRDGKVTHRSVHDRLVAVTGKTPNQSKVAVSSSSGSGMRKEETSLDEDLRNWFSKTHPEGDWKRINSKGEAIGPCAREPGEPKPKCMSKEKRQQLSKKERAAAVAVKRKHDPVADRSGKGGKPVNVSNYGKGKLSESYDLSDSSAMNLLLLGSSVDEHDFQIGEQKEVKLLKDKTGKVRVFMLRAAAAREAHTHGGTVIKYKNGYVIQLKENENDKIHTKTVRTWLEGRQTSVGWTSPSSNREGQGLLTEASGSLGSTSDRAEESRERPKITLAEIRSKKEKLQEEKQWDRSAWTESTQINEIDRGIEPGVSMAGAGESIGRDMGEKIKKRSHKVTTVEAIGAGGEMATSMSDYNENDLRRKGIDLKTFKAKRPIG